MKIEKRPSLGMGGYPAQEYWKGSIFLGKVTRTGTYSFWWVAEDGIWDTNDRCIKAKTSGHSLDAKIAERDLLSAMGIKAEITNECQTY